MRRTAVALAIALAAAGCTRDEPVRLRAADPDARPGGHLTIGISPPQSIEPSATDAHDTAGSLVVRTMCDPLIQFDPVTGEPVPAIAESWLVTGRGITLKLRRGVRFHDGTELTSDDVAYSLYRVALAETASPVAELLRPVRGFEFVHGEIVDPEGDVPTELAGVRTIDRYSIEIELGQHRADFIGVLGHPAASVVSRAAAERNPDTFATTPICAGPYRLASGYRPGDPQIELVRSGARSTPNLGFTRGGAGYAERITFRIFEDRAAQVAAFGAGELDVAEVGWDQLPHPDVVSAPSPTLEYVGLPVGTEPFDRRAVRVAMSVALNRVALVDDVYDGGRVAATGLLPPTVDDEPSEACTRRVPPRGDAAEARRMLSEAGVDLRGTRVRMIFNDEFRNRSLMQAVGERWSEVFGIVPELVAMPWERYLEAGTGQPGFDGPFRMSWAPQYPSVDGYLAPLFASGAIGTDNLTRFASRDFDLALEREARRATDAEDRRAAYERLEDEICGQMPVVPIAFGATHHLIRTSRVASAVETFTDRTTGAVIVRELYVR